MPAEKIAFVNLWKVEIARAYEKNGADCLSIVTDEKHFQVLIIPPFSVILAVIEFVAFI